MASDSTTSTHNLLVRRKLSVASIVLITFLVLLIINIGSYVFLKRMGAHLESGLDSRLRTAASLATMITETSLGNLYDPRDLSLISLNLSQIRLGNDFEAAYLIDPQLNVLIDSDIQFDRISRGYIIEDSTAIQRAIQTGIATSELHRVSGNPFKSVYALISDLEGNKALLVLEANAEFLSAIDSFRRGLYIGSIASGLLFLILTVFLIWATSVFLRTEARLQESQRLAALGQMAATVAHEIRNPLGIIKSTSDVLREKYADRHESKELFYFINDEIRRLNRLVTDFLTFSREPILHKTKADLCRVLTDAIDSIQQEFPNIDINTDVPERPLLVQLDPDNMHQVFLNILLNAVQAMEGDSGQVTIRLSQERQRSNSIAFVTIADAGPGFPDLRQIFDPFYTTKTRGTGLGLAVSKSIIEKHGGGISAENANQGGAVIHIWLPID